MEEEEKQLLQQGIKDRFVPLLTSSLTVSTPNPPVYYDAELIRDGLTYRGKLSRDGEEEVTHHPDRADRHTGIRRFLITDEQEQRYEGVCFSDGAVSLRSQMEKDTCSYACFDHLLRFYFHNKAISVSWLDE